jgi:UDP-glucose 4-epimerase
VSAPRVLVTGGAGFIGSVVVEELLASSCERVVVLDDLSMGHRAAVVAPARLARGDIADGEVVGRILREERIDAVIHLAASSSVGESVANPAKYYANNVVKGLALLDAVVRAGVRRFVFSSTAAVYGEPASSPITETFAIAPTNPYGETKRIFEKALEWYRGRHALDYFCLRYFNAAGATQRNGEQHAPETHLIPLVLAAAKGELHAVTVFGDDYPTPDGTCVRDYIHVSDLARAHVLALQALTGPSGIPLNLGCGGGFSVAQVIDIARRVTGREIRIERGARRPGDPAVLVASSERARQVLSWRPSREELGLIIEDAWKWSLAHPLGYVPEPAL